MKARTAILKVRRDPQFGDIRPEVLALDGSTVIVRYGGEFEKGPADRPAYRKAGDSLWDVIEPRDFPVPWLASGDLEFVE